MPRVYNRKRCGAEGTTAGGGAALLVENAFFLLSFLPNRSTALEKLIQRLIHGSLGLVKKNMMKNCFALP